METDSTSSFQRKDRDEESMVDVSQVSELTKVEHSQAVDTGAVQSLDEKQREVNRSETFKANNGSNESFVTEQSGGGPQTSQHEGDKSKGEEIFSPSHERLEQNVIQNIPEDVASADVPVRDSVQENSGKPSDAVIRSVSETQGADGIITSDLFSTSTGPVGDTTHPDTATSSQNRPVESAVSSTCNAERITDRDMETEEGHTQFEEETVSPVPTESTLKRDLDDANISSASISSERDLKYALPSENDTTTSTSYDGNNERERVEQKITDVFLPDSHGKDDETDQRDDEQTLHETEVIRESCSGGTVKLDDIPSSPQHEPSSILDQAEDRQGLSIAPEIAKPTGMDLTDVEDCTGDSVEDKEVGDTNTEGQEWTQENTESVEVEEKEETFEREEEKEETKNKQDEDVEMQDGVESTSVFEAETVSEDDDKNDEKPEECEEANGDEDTGDAVEEEEGDVKEMGEDDDQDEDEKENSPEGKSERRRASPIRCFE